jgi:hypothetical protein
MNDSRYASDGCMYVCVCMSVCNEMYCDETTNAVNIRFGTNIPHDNTNRSAKRHKKILPSWPPAAMLNFRKPTMENTITFKMFEISTTDGLYFTQWLILLNCDCIGDLPPSNSHP